jgi:hypothetical protein
MSRKHYIIDLAELVTHPEIVSYKHEGCTFWISDYFFDHKFKQTVFKSPTPTFIDYLKEAEMSFHVTRFTVPESLNPILETKMHKGFKIVRSIDYIPILRHQRLSLIEEYGEENVFLVSDFLKSAEAISTQRLLYELKGNGAVRDEDLFAKSKSILDEGWVEAIQFSVIACIIIIIASYSEWRQLIQSNNLIASILFVVVSAAIWLLFKLRRRRRLIYGLIECFVGIVFIGRVLFFSDAKYLSRFDFFGILSGIYIVIRGLDNIESGMKDTKNEHYLKSWKRIF